MLYRTKRHRRELNVVQSCLATHMRRLSWKVKLLQQAQWFVDAGGGGRKSKVQPNLQDWQHAGFLGLGHDREFEFGSHILTVQDSEVTTFGFENGTSKGCWRQLFHGSPNSTGILLQQFHPHFFWHEVWLHDDLAHAWIETPFCGL